VDEHGATGSGSRAERAETAADIDPDLLHLPTRARTPVPVLAAIAAGGVLGTLGRYGVSRVVHVAPDSFPWATFTANVSGAFLLGLLLTVILERWPPSRYARPFIAIGVLGGYTTFSTFMVESDLLVKDGAVGIAALYVGASLLAGFVAVWCGIVVARLALREGGR
jgi:CrcB protein